MVWLVVWAGSALGQSSANDTQSDLARVVAGNNRFAFELYRQLTWHQDEANLFVSPFSASAALAMAYAGARGQTASEMAQTLHFDLAPDHFQAVMGQLIGAVDAGNERGFELHAVNRLWGQQGFPFKPDYLHTLEHDYDAGLGEVDFKLDQEGARKTINDWVAEQTHDKIQDLLPADALTIDTRAVLTNAVYFQGDWQQPFPAESTRPAAFRLLSGESLSVPMMQRTREFREADLPGYQFLEMPYQGGDVSMLVILPKQVDGLAAVEASLSPEAIDQAIAQMHVQHIQLSLPKFGLTSRFDLSAALGDLGMPTAFSDFADFSGIADEPLAMTHVDQQTFLRVDEKGSEAAAATAVGMELRSYALPFVVDHPFGVLIRDNRTGSTLFMGHVVEPEAPAAGVPEPAAWALLAVGVFMITSAAWLLRYFAWVRPPAS